MRIIANSLPKSGTHLLVRFLELLDLTEHEPGLTGAMIRPSNRNLIKKIIKYQKRTTVSSSDSYQIDLDCINSRIKGHHLEKYLSNVKDWEFLSAHVPFSSGLDDLFRNKGFKMLYIIRDPRDVLLSYYNHQHSI